MCFWVFLKENYINDYKVMFNMVTQTITPWEVKGDINYDKLIKDFGTNKISESMIKRIEKITGKKAHHFLRREIFFSERDLKWLLDEYEKGNKFFLYTGRGPSGDTHMGHIVPWMFTKWLQDVFDVDLYFQLTDDEKFLFKKDLSLKDVKSMAYENMKDVIALGFNPKKTHIIIDTDCIAEMYPIALEVAKKINFTTVKSAFGFTDQNNIGSIFYTAMQSVPAVLPSVRAKKNIPCLIPMGIDQDPHFRLGRDVLVKLGYYKPAAMHCRFLPGLGGLAEDGKMSTSTSNATIFTTDSVKDVKNKINKHAFSGGQPTIEEHRRLGGNPDIDVAYQWLVFFEEDDKKLSEIYYSYKKGELLSGELKKILIDRLNKFLAKHQEKRNLITKKEIESFIFR